MSKQKQSKTIHVPTSATIIVEGGISRIESAEYADVTPQFMARFLINQFGADAIFQYSAREVIE